jgi:restriction endonuclease S subunit
MEMKPGYKQTEIGVIPAEWDIKHLGDLGAVVRGGSPRPAGDPRYFNGNFIPWLTVAALTNISEHQLTVGETVGFLTEEGSKHSRTLPAGTLIISNSGATLGVAKLLGVTCCANDGIAAIVNQRLGDKPFICFYVNTKTKNLREVVATGNGQPNLNTGLIRKIAISFPPLPEQRAIATALSDVDALLGGLDRLIAKKRDLKQAAIQQLLTGQTRLPGFHGEWEVKRLGDVVDADPENLSSETRPDFAFNYIALEDVDRGFLRSYSEQRFATAPSRARRKLRLDDVLVSTVRPNLQSHLLFRAEGSNWVCSGRAEARGDGQSISISGSPKPTI